MENQLKALQDRWTVIEWLMDPYKDTDVPLLKVRRCKSQGERKTTIIIIIDLIFHSPLLYSSSFSTQISEEDYEALENDQLVVQGMNNSRYKAQFEKEVGKINRQDRL